MNHKHHEGRGCTCCQSPGPATLLETEQALYEYLLNEDTTSLRLTVIPWAFLGDHNSKKGKQVLHINCLQILYAFVPLAFPFLLHFYCCVTNHHKTQWLETPWVYYFSGFCRRSLTDGAAFSRELSWGWKTHAMASHHTVV